VARLAQRRAQEEPLAPAARRLHERHGLVQEIAELRVARAPVVRRGLARLPVHRPGRLAVRLGVGLLRPPAGGAATAATAAAAFRLGRHGRQRVTW